MSTNTTEYDERTKPRTDRALSGYLNILPEDGEIFIVVGQNDYTYTVDASRGRYFCPYTKCRITNINHQHRFAFAPGKRPEDCDCWDATAGLLYWPCYRDGFEEPNPAADHER